MCLFKSKHIYKSTKNIVERCIFTVTYFLQNEHPDFDEFFKILGKNDIFFHFSEYVTLI